MSVRRLLLTLACAGVAVVGVGPPAQADAPDNVSTFCRSVDDFGQKHGGCVASLTAGNIVPNLANFCRDPVVRAEAAELVGADEVTHGQCIGILRDFFGA